ncbi:TonB-dependent receptor, partial [Bacteroidota bacterium]
MKKSSLTKLFLAFIIAMITYSFVQGQSIKGKVTDDSKNPLPDVYLINQNTGIHSHTNELGTFNLVETNIGDTILVSHIGYTNQRVVISKINLEDDFNIFLKKTPIELEQVLITPDINSLNQLSKVELQTNPVNSSQEILRKVPGLIIGQHAGGGKAEQMFLRGFDIDHGTDVNITVDGLPVNMVSHAHGQGYADLHFLIPEIIANIDYGKGPYYADKGNFTTAGYAAFHTKDRIDNSLVSIDYGKFNTLRTLALIDLLDKSNNANAYIAGEYTLTDGAFESPQHFNRLNLFSKYSTSISSDQKITLQASYFQSKWDASGQIPQRAVDANLINRFGAIDDTEGGTTSRTNLSLKHFKYINDKTSVKNRVYYTKYDFELYSNFTFYLNDPINGDQIKQKETRNIIGIESVLNRNIKLDRFNFDLQAGVGFKYDDINSSELSNTLNRKTTLDTISLGDIDESNMYGFISSEFNLGNWLIKPAVRFDFFKFDYINQLANAYSTLTNDKIIASPKLNIIYSPAPTWQLYLKSGIGFHSNDSRLVVAQNGGSILPLAYGADFGTIWKPSNRLVINTTLWYLFLEQEFVYVG